MFEPLDPAALEAAANRAGLTVEQVVAALVQFRHVNSQMEEPEWFHNSHMTMTDCAISSYRSPETAILKCVQTPRKNTHEWGEGVVYFSLGQSAYETFGEAKSAELRGQP